jgi:hypothetical protein
LLSKLTFRSPKEKQKQRPLWEQPFMAQSTFDFNIEARPSTRTSEMEGWFQIVICRGDQRKPVTDWQPAPQARDMALHRVLQSAAQVASQQIAQQYH